MVDYIGPTAALLESGTRASTANKDRASAEKMKTQEILGSLANTGIQEQGAMNRIGAQSKQAQLLENMKNQATMALANLQAQEASKLKEKELKASAEKDRQENYFTMTPNTVKGVKTSIGLDFKDLEGQEVNKDLILALIGAKYKSDIAELLASSRAEKDKNTSTRDLNKELDTIERDIKANRDKLFGMSLKDLPAEVWQGGKPGDVRALFQNISKGKLGKLSPEAESQIKLVAGYVNTMKSKQDRANAIHKQLGSTETDYTGMGLVGDEKPVDYKSAEEVAAAFKAGQIDRATAKKILDEKFGIK